MQRMRKEVSPVLAVVLILAALATVQALYLRGLLGEQQKLAERGERGGGGGRGASVPTGLPEVNVETVAGGEQAGFRDGSTSEALLDGPAALAVSDSGTVYIADSRNHVIRALSRDGRLRTLAGRPKEPGYAEGRGGAARFSAPAGLALAPDGSLFVADTGNHRIRRIAADGSVSTWAGAATPRDDLGKQTGGYRDGPAPVAQFRYPVGLAADGSGGLYLADSGNQRIRRVSAAGQVTTVPIEGGPEMSHPTQICLSSDGGIRVADTSGHALWSGPANGPLRPWQGDTSQAGSGFSPSGICAIRAGAGPEQVYVLDAGNHCLWRVEGSQLLLVAGQREPGKGGSSDGTGDTAQFSCPAGLTSGPEGALYLADFGSSRIRRVWWPERAKEEH